MEIFRDNLKLLLAASQIMGAQLLVAKQATLIVDDLPDSLKIKCNYSLHGFNHEAHVDAFKQIYKIIDDEIAKDYIIDVTSLSGNKKYFYDHVHPTDAGTTEISKIIAASIIQIIENCPNFSKNDL